MRRFDFLDVPAVDRTISICGRNAVQITAPRGQLLDLGALAGRLESVGRVERSGYFVRCRLYDVTGVWLTVFPDGRLIVDGTDDIARARSIAARFVGL
jgi:adenylyltransferase/sulfurtransferase